jgi:DNA-binding transcriptional regulator LsrR (DeoR family)
MASKTHLRRRVTDEERIEWATLRFGFKEGKAVRAKDLVEKYDRAPAVITRGIQQAFTRGLVKVVPTVDFEGKDLQKRNTYLERRICERFPRLKTAIVIQVEPPPVGTMEMLTTYNNEVHQKLGAALAKAIANCPVDLDLNGKTIAFSSGRGVRDVVEELNRCPTLKANKVTLSSLTGNMFFQTSKTPFAPMDADQNVGNMRRCFPADVMIEIIGAALAPPPQRLEQLRRRTWLAKWDPAPDYAILGVGALYGGHRFWDFATSEETDGSELYLAPIARTLRKLVSSCKNFADQAPNYSPVADIANHLFFVDPPKNVMIPPPQAASIKALIRKINRRLLNVQAEQLKKIPDLILVAGTRKKTLAILTLLNNFKNLTCLTVDSEVAASLLELE